MPLFVADYLADTAHLSAAEHGAYLLLIMNYWQREKPLPADDRKLARIARMSDAEWEQSRETLAEFFVVDGEGWSHRRADEHKDLMRRRPHSAEWARLRSAVFERDGFTCQYCGAVGRRLECDHIIPASKGGYADMRNLTTACRDCNQSKRDTPLDEWLATRVTA